MRQMNAPRFTLILLCITVFVLMLSAPASLAEAYHRGGFYVFSREFIEDIPARLTGPGKLRFIIQPLVAIVLGIRSGLDDARKHRPRYLAALLLHRDRREFATHGLTSIASLLLMGILIDSIVQWLILGVSYPGAALVVGPVLVVTPYVFARSVANDR
jgi:hypothetical protein